MIPPSQAAVSSLPPSQLHARLDPSTGERIVAAEEGPPVDIDPVLQRKIDAATGRGFRREAPTTDHESGDAITLKGKDGVFIPCKYCLALPCRGLCWVFEGEVRFKCDACGKKQKLGYGEERAKKTNDELAAMDTAEKNRRRAWRETEVQEEEVRQQALSSVTDRQFVDSAFFS